MPPDFRSQLPGAGKLPMAPGTVIPVPPEQEKILRNLGWQEGEPIPNVAAAIARAKQQAYAVYGQLPVDPTTPPVQQRTVDITALPLQVQEELRATFKQMQAQASQIPEHVQWAPGIREGLALGTQIQTQQAMQPKHAQTIEEVLGFNTPASPPLTPTNSPGASSEFYSNLVSPPPAMPMPMPRPVGSTMPGPPRDVPVPGLGDDPYDNTRKLAEYQTQLRAEQPAATPQPTPQPQLELTELERSLFPPPVCVHCGWPSDQPDEIEVTDKDKLAYLTMFYGRPTTRFHREFKLLGGHVTVVFRSLTSAEEDIAFQQLEIDTRGDNPPTPLMRVHKLQRYQFAMALDSVAWRNSGMRKFPAVTLLPVPPDSAETVLIGLLRALDTHVMPEAGLRKAFMTAFMRFQNLIEKLEANVTTESFWAGIDAPR